MDTSVSIRGLCSLAMLVVDSEVLRRLETSSAGASSDYSMLLLVLIQKCGHQREDVASCACWALSEICESETSVEIVSRIAALTRRNRTKQLFPPMPAFTLYSAGVVISKSNGQTARFNARHAFLDLH